MELAPWTLFTPNIVLTFLPLGYSLIQQIVFYHNSGGHIGLTDVTVIATMNGSDCSICQALY